MKKRLSAILLCVMLVVTSLVGCSKKEGAGVSIDETASSQPPKEATTEVATTEEASEPVNLTMSWWGGEVRNQYTQELLADYSAANSSVTFEATPTSWDGYFEKLATQAAGGNLPSIVQMDYLYISTYAKNGTVADLTPFIEDGTIDVSNFDEKLMQSGQIDGIQAGIPLSTSMTTFAYNPSVLEEAGLSVPALDWTWDNFESMCLQVKEKTGKFGFASNFADTTVLRYWLRQYGETLYSADGTSLGFENDQHVIEFMDLFKRLTDAGAMPTPDEYIGIVANGEEARPVAKNEGAFVYTSNTHAVQVAGVNDTIQLSAPPLVEGGEKSLWLKPAMFFCISATASKEEQKAAAEFINWFLNSEAAADKIGTERGIPVSSKIREYLLGKPEMNIKQKEMFAYYDVAVEKAGECPLPDPVGISEINKVFSNIMDKVMYEGFTSAEAAASFREQTNSILAKNK